MTTPAEVFDLAIGLRAVHQHVFRTLGKRRFRAMMKQLKPAINIRADTTKIAPSASAFQFAQEATTEEERAAYIAAAVELRLQEDAEKLAGRN